MGEPGNSKMCFLFSEAHSYSGETGLRSVAEATETAVSTQSKGAMDQQGNESETTKAREEDQGDKAESSSCQAGGAMGIFRGKPGLI